MDKKKYEPVIGLEVHVELKTSSKMFCPNSADYFGQKPNIHTCPVCLGLPGALPYTNKQAIEQCIKIGLALNCKVSKHAVFERKNYFYPDLPKGYQISQYRWPLCTGGFINLPARLDSARRAGKAGVAGRKIRINRVHQEEDTAKLVHQFGAKSLVDFNRSGVPLVEIVTEPDFSDTGQVRDYAKKLQQIFRYLGVSSADMEKGEMRIEANVSLRSLGSHLSGVKQKLPDYRVELKNINSFRFAVAAIEYEIERQGQALTQGVALHRETRGWDEVKRETYVQRVKEEANDYRYFPEPDIPPLEIDSAWVEEIEGSMPELPAERARRYVESFGIAGEQARILTSTRELADYFEETVKVGEKYGLPVDKIANTLVNKKFDREKVLPARLVEILREDKSKRGMSDEDISKVVEKVLRENKKAVEDYRGGKENALKFLVGQAMAKTKGGADAKVVLEALKRRLREEV